MAKTKQEPDWRDLPAELSEAETAAPAQPSPLDEPNCTVRTFCSGSLHDPIMKAFISCEERVHGTRKLTDAQWAQLIQDFKSAAR